MPQKNYKNSLKKILTNEEVKIFETYKTPSKIQDFINSIPMRADEAEPIVRSPRAALQAHMLSCIEGALLASAMLAYHGYKTYILDLKVDPKNKVDSDHVIAIWKQGGYFGAISKTNHSVLRYREPIYASVRELAMTYFHEYFLNDGKKNLRSFSEKYPLFEKHGIDWITALDDLYEMACELDDFPHTNILSKAMQSGLRKADPIEIEATKN